MPHRTPSLDGCGEGIEMEQQGAEVWKVAAEVKLQAYCEFVGIDDGDLCVQAGSVDDRCHAVTFGYTSKHSSTNVHMSPDEARAIAAHLVGAADRFDAIYGGAV